MSVAQPGALRSPAAGTAGARSLAVRHAQPRARATRAAVSFAPPPERGALSADDDDDDEEEEAAAAAGKADKERLVSATRRIRALGLARDAVGAVEELAALGASGVVPDVLAVTATLRACVVAGDTPRAQRVFDELTGAPPPARAFVKQNLHEQKKHSYILTLCLCFLGSGAVVPDEMLFVVLLRALGDKEPVSWTEMSVLLGKMKQTWRITPTALTYNSLLEVCARTNDYERGCQARAAGRLFVKSVNLSDSLLLLKRFSSLTAWWRTAWIWTRARWRRWRRARACEAT